MQSIYNNQLQSLNNRFALVTAYLTVLGTAFLVPNTIATSAENGLMAGQMAAQCGTCHSSSVRPLSRP